jgi:two-component system, NarL family, response regulator YdfI
MVARLQKERDRGVTRVVLIAPAGRDRDRWEEVLDAAGAQVIESLADFESVTDELLDATDVLLGGLPANSTDEALERLQAQGLLRDSRVIILNNARASSWTNHALRAGVRGILPSDVGAMQLEAALEAVTRGLIILHPGDTQPANDELEPIDYVEPLTAREREVLQMLAQGRGNKDIAARLNISEHTVKFHVASILGKLGAGTRTEAVSLALRRGLILL